jgi:hypothetical protein
MSYSRDLDRAAAEYGEISSAELVRMIEEEDLAIAAAARAGRRRGGFRGRALQHSLACRFGLERGWVFSHTSFGLVTLQRGKRHSGGRSDDEGNGYFGGEISSLFDHPYWYRRDGKAAALTAHLYDLGNEKRRRCEEVAAHFGCVFETPDFPSWWNPGGTVLVAYVGPAGR